jgi:hypothetical protein
MQFVKMVQFTRLVKADGQLKEFNFRKLNNPGDPLFTVNVCTERGDRIIFNIQKKDNNWKIQSDEIPKWVLQNENSLGAVIEDELSSGNW